MRIGDCRISIVDCTGRSQSLWLFAGVLPLVAIFVGCGDSGSVSPMQPGGAETKTAEADDVKITLTIQPVELPFTKKATLTIEAVAPKGTTIDLNTYEAAVAGGKHQFEYRVRALRQRNAEPDGSDKLRWLQAYEVEFFLPGEYEFPPAGLRFTPAADSSRAPVELKTEPLKVIALSTEAAQIPPEELAKIDLPDPVELKDPWSRWWWAAIPVGMVLAALAVVLLRRRTREQAALAEQIPAHEWARRAIAELVAADLVSKGRVQEFYYRISAIVRGYIERRFSVSAPEMTTEEFLAATAGDFRFAGPAADELQSFLTACDLVKYARHRPATGEWNDLLRTAVNFVERTREVPRTDGGSAGAERVLTGAAT